MPLDLSVSQAASQIRERKISSTELVRACLDRIRQVDGTVCAVIEVDEADALRQAAEADALLSQSPDQAAARPLLGIPIGMKDLLAVKGQPLRCASRILGDFISPYDGTAVSRLKNAGAIPFARLNMDEFAMGSSTENSAFSKTTNPWNSGHVPGGSSGGSAAAVAAREMPAALGTDTGGSIRQPAAFCGCTGLKPTYGRVSRYGLVAFASSFDQIGPMTRDAVDAGLILHAIAGHDRMDSTSVPKDIDPAWLNLNPDLKGKKIGIPREYRRPELDPAVTSAWDEALKHLQNAGAEVVEISLPRTDYAIATYYILTTAEASSNLARFEGIRYGQRVDGPDPMTLNSRTRGSGFGPEVKRRIILGTYVLSSGYYDAYYLKAQKVRTLIRQDFEEAFRSVDAIVAPTTPTPAFAIGQKTQDPLEMYLSDIFTISSNLAGNCSISVPCGFSGSPALPLGLQIIGPAFREDTVLNMAHAFQLATDWHTRFPEL